MPDVKLSTGGLTYGGWKSVKVRRDLEQLCGSFEIEVSEIWPGQDFTARIQPGDPCMLHLGDRPLVNGYVDDVSIAHDAKKHSVTISGRDKTADLVDCSAIRKTGQWQGLKLERIAQELCAPFGIEVKAEVDTGKAFPTFALQEGESVFEAIDRLSRIRALLLATDGEGNLVITRPGLRRVATALVLGENILEASATLDMRDRFSEYVFKGQAAGTDFFNAKQAAQIRASAKDPGVKRYRPLVVVSESQDVAASLKERALWEANVRAARSTDISVTVQGWEHADGLWEVNSIVPMRDAWLRVDDELLVKAVTFSVSEGGTTTQLDLTRADAYTTLPLKQANAGGVAAAFWSLPKPEVSK